MVSVGKETGHSKGGSVMFQHYNVVLVVLSYAISVFGSFTGLTLAAKIPEASGSRRTALMVGAAISLGGAAIWAMHFVAMLAYDIPGMRASYNVGMTVESLLLAIAGTGIGVVIISGGEGWGRLLAGGTVTGLSVAAMHYLGMAAMNVPATKEYNVGLVALSVVAATAAFWLMQHARTVAHRVGSALVMGVAVCGMHYTGMAALTLVPLATAPSGYIPSSMNAISVATWVVSVAIIVLGVALGAEQFLVSDEA